MLLCALQIPLEELLSFLPSLCYLTEYRHGNKNVETKELSSLCTRLEETEPSLASKNTNSALYSFKRNRGTAPWVACGTSTKQKLQFVVQKITHMSHHTCIFQTKREASDKFACLCGLQGSGGLGQGVLLKVLWCC